MRSIFSLAIVATLIVGSTTAFAQDGPAEKAADVAFQEGRTALTKGNLEVACAKLAESDRLAPTGRAVLNLADCFERRGMVSSAYTKFLEAASRAVQANRPDAERHARERAARLEPRLARMSIVVPKDSELAGLEIKRDGAVLPQSLWNVGELADPGTSHTYEASAPGKNTWTQTITTEEGKTSRVELRWQEVPDAVGKQAKAAPAAATAPAPSSNDDAMKPLAYGALGVGVVGLAVGTIGGLQVLSAKSTVEAHCNPGRRECDQEGLDAAKSGSTWSVVSPIAFGVGAVGIAAGAFLLVKGSTEKPSRVSVTPSLGPTGGGLVIGGRL
jgi:hypothetical protein